MLESLHPVLRDITSPVNNKLHLVSRRGWHSIGSVGSADDGTPVAVLRLALAQRPQRSCCRGKSPQYPEAHLTPALLARAPLHPQTTGRAPPHIAASTA